MSLARFFSLLIFSTSSAFAYSHTTDERGNPVRWRYGQKLQLAGNPLGPASITHEAFRSGVLFGLQQWKQAARGLFDFDYWQGTDSKTYPASLASNGLSSVFFASRSTETTDPNVIGYTQLWFNSRSGDITETDIILNDRNYTFTTTPSDTTSRPSGVKPAVYLNSVLTHEIGHSLGMGHSGDLNSSMFFVEYMDQYKLGCDDQAGVRHLYAAHDDTGSLSGTVLSPQGLPIGGAQIIAISKKSGLPIASTLSNSSGGFFFGSLEPGGVGIAVAPFLGPPDSVGSVYSSLNRDFCSGKSYPTQWATREDHHELIQFGITPHEQIDAGAIRLHCDPVRSSGGTLPGEIAPPSFVDSSPVGRTLSYDFIAEGEFKVTALTHLLLSPYRIQLEAVHENGTRIPIKTLSPVYQSESGFKIWETQIRGSAFGKIRIRATPILIPDSFPSSLPVKSAAEPFFVITFNADTAPDNPRCVQEVTDREYLSPDGPPPRYTSTTSAREAVGFCGTPNAEASALHPSLGVRNIPTGSRIGWFWPFFWILAFQLNSSRRRAKLKALCKSKSSPSS